MRGQQVAILKALHLARAEFRTHDMRRVKERTSHVAATS